MSTIPEQPQGDDPLLEEIAALRKADPAPALSGMAKAAIVDAVAAVPSPGLWHVLRVQTEMLLRPPALAMLGCAAVAGVMTGVFLPGLETQPSSLTPEEELIAIYTPDNEWVSEDTLWADEGEVH